MFLTVSSNRPIIQVAFGSLALGHVIKMHLDAVSVLLDKTLPGLTVKKNSIFRLKIGILSIYFEKKKYYVDAMSVHLDIILGPGILTRGPAGPAVHFFGECFQM